MIHLNILLTVDNNMLIAGLWYWLAPKQRSLVVEYWTLIYWRWIQRRYWLVFWLECVGRGVLVGARATGFILSL